MSLVLAISRIPYARPTQRTALGVLREWRGTCSTKHLLLAEVAAQLWPETDPLLWHRVYRVMPEMALERWGSRVAARVPSDGLVDVHTYALLALKDRDVRIDVTFPVNAWDGTSDMPLACGPGADYPAGDDAVGSKAALVRRWCDPSIREPFIDALMVT